MGELGLILLITKWQDVSPGLSPLDSDLPRIVGRRNPYVRDFSRSRKGVAYDSLRDRFEGFDSAEELIIAPPA